MKKLTYILFISLLCFSTSLFAQKDSISINKTVTSAKFKALGTVKYNPLSPARAAFYSAVLPGLGQLYNKRYSWQLPLIYGGMGTAAYYYLLNDRDYHKFRSAYKRRKAGIPDRYDGKEGKIFISKTSLEHAQRQTRKNREMSLISGVVAYALQIVEASVTAHLLQFDDTDSLTIRPTSLPSTFRTDQPVVCLSLKYKF